MRLPLKRVGIIVLGALFFAGCGGLPSSSSSSVDGDLPGGQGAAPMTPVPAPPAPAPKAVAVTPAASPARASAAAASPGAPAASNDSDAVSTFDNIEFVDESISRKLAILRVGSQPTETNLLSVFVGLRNKTGHRLALEVETIYKDKAGNALNQASWIPLTLQPHEEREYHSASISDQATDFLVRIRRPGHTP